jgi:hypothetical protein
LLQAAFGSARSSAWVCCKLAKAQVILEALLGSAVSGASGCCKRCRDLLQAASRSGVEWCYKGNTWFLKLLSSKKSLLQDSTDGERAEPSCCKLRHALQAETSSG